MIFTPIVLLSLAFCGWLAWTLYESLKDEGVSGFMDYLSTIWVGGGALAGIITAIRALI